MRGGCLRDHQQSGQGSEEQEAVGMTPCQRVPVLIQTLEGQAQIRGFLRRRDHSICRKRKREINTFFNTHIIKHLNKLIGKYPVPPGSPGCCISWLALFGFPWPILKEKPFMASPAAVLLPGKWPHCPQGLDCHGCTPNHPPRGGSTHHTCCPAGLKNTFSREQFLCETGLSVPLLHPQFIFMQRFQTH